MFQTLLLEHLEVTELNFAALLGAMLCRVKSLIRCAATGTVHAAALDCNRVYHVDQYMYLSGEIAGLFDVLRQHSCQLQPYQRVASQYIAHLLPQTRCSPGCDAFPLTTALSHFSASQRRSFPLLKNIFQRETTWPSSMCGPTRRRSNTDTWRRSPRATPRNAAVSSHTGVRFLHAPPTRYLSAVFQ